VAGDFITAPHNVPDHPWIELCAERIERDRRA
jgi:hypothetical protein